MKRALGPFLKGWSGKSVLLYRASKHEADRSKLEESKRILGVQGVRRRRQQPRLPGGEARRTHGAGGAFGVPGAARRAGVMGAQSLALRRFTLPHAISFLHI